MLLSPLIWEHSIIFGDLLLFLVISSKDKWFMVKVDTSMIWCKCCEGMLVDRVGRVGKMCVTNLSTTTSELNDCTVTCCHVTKRGDPLPFHSPPSHLSIYDKYVRALPAMFNICLLYNPLSNVKMLWWVTWHANRFMMSFLANIQLWLCLLVLLWDYCNWTLLNFVTHFVLSWRSCNKFSYVAK